ncbi:hypothetical protein PENTCL1PPCAC_9662, partial [Pristionchus entomophagus]
AIDGRAKPTGSPTAGDLIGRVQCDPGHRWIDSVPDDVRDQLRRRADSPDDGYRSLSGVRRAYRTRVLDGCRRALPADQSRLGVRRLLCRWRRRVESSAYRIPRADNYRNPAAVVAATQPSQHEAGLIRHTVSSFPDCERETCTHHSLAYPIQPYPTTITKLRCYHCQLIARCYEYVPIVNTVIIISDKTVTI